jgi:hypothetical protein
MVHPSSRVLQTGRWIHAIIVLPLGFPGVQLQPPCLQRFWFRFLISGTRMEQQTIRHLGMAGIISRQIYVAFDTYAALHLAL